MAKIKAARPKKKAGVQPGAVSCVFLLVLGFVLLGLLFYVFMKSV